MDCCELARLALWVIGGAFGVILLLFAMFFGYSFHLGDRTLKLEKNEDGEDELTRIHLFNIQVIEDFTEFYQYNLYKGGRAEVLYPDPLAHRVARCMLKITDNIEIDRKGVVRVEWNFILKEAKPNSI